jgi:DNA-binding SARP family transcriptional activator
VARPFRFQPPAPPEIALHRPRLLELLAHRWDRRLTTVVAGPGFGKTALLGATMAEAQRTGAGQDVWLSCEPSDESADSVERALGEACGLAGAAGIDAVCDWVWSQAPGPVTLVLDDVHEIPARSPGAALVSRLVEDLPGNGHLLLASREALPVPVSRLAASGQLVRVREADLVFDEGELEAFARAHRVDTALLSSTGGWPALAALTASAGSDLVGSYIWEEVLAQIGNERAGLLARLAIVGGGDDAIASALAGRAVRVDDLVDGLPLVQRSPAGPVALHPLWTPTLRAVLAPDEADEARRAAAAVHRAAHRVDDAIELLAEAGAWDEVLDTIRDAQVQWMPQSAADFGRWYRLLPHDRRESPVARMAAGLELQPKNPLASMDVFAAAAAGFREAGDIDGETATLAAHGLVAWWANDPAAMLTLHRRVVELAAAGSNVAGCLERIARAAVAHLVADSPGVFAALADADDLTPPGWIPVVQWLRSAAYRREGQLDESIDVLDRVARSSGRELGLSLQHARLRAQWLRGEVDAVCEQLPGLRERYERAGDQFNAIGVQLEIRARQAWLGEAAAEAPLADLPQATAPEANSPMVNAMRLLVEAAHAVERGDEADAADLLRAETIEMIGRPDGWYWRDRGATALVHVLVPETRPVWESQALPEPHRRGLEMALALEAARAGDLGPVGALRWPDPGVVRTQLPARWVVELLAAGAAAGNPAPPALVTALGSSLREWLRALVDEGTASAPVLAAAKRMAAELPAVPAGTVEVNVLGPLEVVRAGDIVSDPDLRRQRVRELLCFLVIRRRARREEIIDGLWPELDDRGRNLRTTLNYLQRVLQPERPASDPPYFLRTDGAWLSLDGPERLDVDAWRLDVLLDDAERAEQAGTPTAAIAAYRDALPLWRGEPYADVPYSDWAEPERARLRARYTAAAIRAGELMLAGGSPGESRAAARRAIEADPTAEPAYQLLARAHLAEDDRAGARHAVDACIAALAELDVEPDASTLALVSNSRQ